jgi:sulfatase modifying factor 1
MYPANPWGLRDVHGTVWEWCRDYYGPYEGPDGEHDPIRASPQFDSRRILRGGSWGTEAGFCRSAYRFKLAPGVTNGLTGFRVVLARE